MLENINEYNLDFSPDGVETALAIGNFVNGEGNRSYQERFPNMGKNTPFSLIKTAFFYS
jgi:hypothetical protein